MPYIMHDIGHDSSAINHNIIMQEIMADNNKIKCKNHLKWTQNRAIQLV